MLHFCFIFVSGHRPGYPMIGILITDGYSSNKAETRKEAMNARLKGIKMFSIGIGNAIDTTELESVASEPKSQFVFTAASFKLLKSIESLLLSKTCEGTCLNDMKMSTYLPVYQKLNYMSNQLLICVVSESKIHIQNKLHS